MRKERVSVALGAILVGVAIVSAWAVSVLGHKASVHTIAVAFALGTLFVLTAIPFLRPQSRGSRDYLEPIYLVALSYALYFGLRTLYIFYRPEEISHGEVFDVRLLSRSLLYVDLGLVALLGGYYGPIAARLAARTSRLVQLREWASRGLLGRLALLCAVGVAVRFIAIRLGVSDLLQRPLGIVSSYAELNTASHSYLANFQQYSEYALLSLLLTGAFRRGVLGRGALACFAVIEAAFVLPTTSKKTLLLVFLLLALWVNYRVRRLRPTLFAGIAVLAALLIFPWVDTYRTIYLERYSYVPLRQAIPLTARATWSILSSMPLEDYTRYSTGAFFGRAHGIDSLCLVVKYTPTSHPFLWGRDYLYLVPAGLIPRAIWLNKPSFSSEEIFELYYWRGSTLATLGAFPGPTMPGDLYMNFGLAGIIAGMFILGVVYRFLYDFFVVRTEASSPGLLFYFIALVPLLHIEGSVLTLSDVLKRLIYGTIFHLVLALRLEGRR